MRNVITSMRLILDVDWTELFERISPVDEVLRAHRGFVEMDFATRNLYRGPAVMSVRWRRVVGHANTHDLPRGACKAAAHALWKAWLFHSSGDGHA